MESIKPKRPQDKWNEKNGLVSKSYKLKSSLINDFAAACAKADVSQAGQLTKMMTEFINDINEKYKFTNW